MWLPFILFGVTVLGCFAAVLVGMSVSNSMQVSDYLQLLLIFSPLLLVAVLATRSRWIGFAIGLLPFSILLPVPVLKRFTIGMAFCIVVFLLVIGGVCFKQYQKQVVKDWGSIFIAIAGFLCWARVLYDRPGSAVLGGAEGGGGMAILFALGFTVYWAFSKVAASRDWDPVKNMTLAFWLACVALAYRILSSKFRGTSVSDDVTDPALGLIYNLYARPAWFVWGIAFAWILYRFGYKRSNLLMNQNLLLVSGVLIALAAFSGHRSRPLFAFFSVMGLAYVYREYKKAFFMFVFASFLGLLGMVGFGREFLPGQVLRAMSIVIPVSEEEARRLATDKGVGGEMGWESDFRAGMYQIAWEKLTHNPVFGAGFEFSSKDLLKLYSTASGGGMSLAQMKLAMTGGYHNSYLQLAVGSGLPSGLLALVGSCIVFWRFMRFAVKMDDNRHRYVCAAIAGCFIPLFGQTLMNGDAAEFFRTVTMLGIMNGIMINPVFRKEGDPELPPEPVVVPKLSEGDIPAGFGGPLKW